MPMTTEEAQHFLDVRSDATLSEIEGLFEQRRAQMQSRLNSAPSPTFMTRYQNELQELEEAYTLLAASHDETVVKPHPEKPQASSDQAILAVNQTLGNGRYTIKELLGEGGMGAVYRAFDENRGKDIAIKVLLPMLPSEYKSKERFLQEAQLTSEMSHPNIVNVFDVQMDGNKIFLTMELLHGQSLGCLLRSLKRQNRVMPLSQALAIIDQVCVGLSYAHQFGVVHRDIKPENIWLSESGPIKIIDFGIARLITTSHLTLSQMSIGTMYYMAPEQFEGVVKIDHRADMYSVGILLYEMLTGLKPSGRINPLYQINKAIPKTLSDAVDKALSANRDERFNDMEAFRRQLHPPKSRLSLSPKTTVMMAAVPLVLGAAFFAYRYLETDKANSLTYAASEPGVTPVAQTSPKTEVVDPSRRNSVVKWRRQIEAGQQKLLDQLTDAETQSQKIQNDLSKTKTAYAASNNAKEKSSLLAKTYETRDRLNQATSLTQGLRAALQGAEGLDAVKDLLRNADQRIDATDWTNAEKYLKIAQGKLQQIGGLPDNLRLDYKLARDVAVHAIDGRWSEGSCNAASPTWTVQDPAIKINWPNVGTFEEKILDAVNGEITVVVVSPEKYKGRLYQYKTASNSMTLSELGSSKSETLKRCP